MERYDERERQRKEVIYSIEHFIGWNIVKKYRKNSSYKIN